jgi:hypothetical protein
VILSSYRALRSVLSDGTTGPDGLPNPVTRTTPAQPFLAFPEGRWDLLFEQFDDPDPEIPPVIVPILIDGVPYPKRSIGIDAGYYHWLSQPGDTNPGVRWRLYEDGGQVFFVHTPAGLAEWNASDKSSVYFDRALRNVYSYIVRESDQFTQCIDWHRLALSETFA